MNPHQVDAPLFALGSLLSKGVILADEVGLGKTIEASLVIAQRWAERRRRILLIVPASLLTCSDIDRFRTVDAYCAWFFNFLRQDLDALTLDRLEVAGKRLAGYHASHKAWGPNAERVPSLIRRALSRPLAYGSLRRAATRLQLGAIPKRATVAN